MPPNALVRLFSKKRKIESFDGSTNSTVDQSKDDPSNIDGFGLFRLDSRNGTKLGENTIGASSRSQVEVKPHTADVIAIHGLGGSAYKTWTHENGVLWLRDFAPNEFPGARIYTFGYDSGFAFSKGTGTMRDFAKSLLEAIKLERVTSEVYFYPKLLY